MKSGRPDPWIRRRSSSLPGQPVDASPERNHGALEAALSPSQACHAFNARSELFRFLERRFSRCSSGNSPAHGLNRQKTYEEAKPCSRKMDPRRASLPTGQKLPNLTCGWRTRLFCGSEDLSYSETPWHGINQCRRRLLDSMREPHVPVSWSMPRAIRRPSRI